MLFLVVCLRPKNTTLPLNPILTIEVNDTTAGNIKLYQEDQEATLPEGIVANEENEEVVPGMYYVFPGTEPHCRG